MLQSIEKKNNTEIQILKEICRLNVYKDTHLGTDVHFYIDDFYVGHLFSPGRMTNVYQASVTWVSDIILINKKNKMLLKPMVVSNARLRFAFIF